MKRLLFILITSIALISCTKDNDENLLQRYSGIWEGTYTGTNDNGTWQITISTDGVVSGDAISTVYTQTFTLTGNVAENGDLNLVIGSASSGSVFNGQLNHVNGTGIGTWSNSFVFPPLTGTWVGNKQ